MPSRRRRNAKLGSLRFAVTPVFQKWAPSQNRRAAPSE